MAAAHSPHPLWLPRVRVRTGTNRHGWYSIVQVMASYTARAYTSPTIPDRHGRMPVLRESSSPWCRSGLPCGGWWHTARTQQTPAPCLSMSSKLVMRVRFPSPAPRSDPSVVERRRRFWPFSGARVRGSSPTSGCATNDRTPDRYGPPPISRMVHGPVPAFRPR